MLAKKHVQNEEEKLVVAKTRKIIAEQSIWMAGCFEKLASNASDNTSKLVLMKTYKHKVLRRCSEN